MKSFLHLVANDLSQKLGNDLSRTVIVFPNRRAGLFLNECLLEISGGTPLWAPQYVTISDLFYSLAPDLAVNDPIDTKLRIVSEYQRLSGHDVVVDHFYGWAERILADFDDVDKNMGDAAAIFRNISELKEYDDTTYLTPEQVAELRRFFAGFDVEDAGMLRENYRRLWDVLGDMYVHLNDSLADAGLAYEGALYRRVIERLQQGQVAFSSHVDHYVFVGFNVLDKVEKELFSHLKREGKAWFYWDYDAYYMSPTHEAGTFMRENLKMFPNELPSDHFDLLSSASRRLEMVAASTEAIQAQYVAPWLKEHLTPDAKQTAVVLCNENLLQPVLHALPDNIEDVNVTKGFPLAHTEVTTMVEHRLGEWERRPPKHTILEMLDELSAMLEDAGCKFVNRPAFSMERFEDVLQSEAYYQMCTIFNRFRHILAEFTDLPMTIVTLRRLIRQTVRQSSIPFHGEPAAGLQVMGVLETRCLDFDHIIMLSVNDGVLPQRNRDNSFIPYLLRKAYGLTTPERRTAVYSYYFYRLLQRASMVTMTYNTSTDGMSTGEMSRFMTQLLVEWPGRVRHATLDSQQHSVSRVPQAVAKPDDLLQRLCSGRHGYDGPSLSPSALSVYQHCQLRFYYSYVCRIKEPEEDPTEFRPNTLGTIFHKAAEIIYQRVIREHQGHVTPDYLKALADNTTALERIVRQAFDETQVNFKHVEANVIVMFIEALLRFDARMGNFRVVGTEHETFCLLEADCGGQRVGVRVGGVIDRLDLVPTADGGWQLRVVDYKTSVSKTELNSKFHVNHTVAKSLDDLFAVDGTRGYMLQTFLYGMMLRHEARHNKEVASLLRYPVAPVLLYTKYLRNPAYVPLLSIADEDVLDFAKYAEAAEAGLRGLIEDILRPEGTFAPTSDSGECTNCPFRALCYL